MWPFQPDKQPEDIAQDFVKAKRQLFPQSYEQIAQPDMTLETQESDKKHNPFTKQGDTLSFLGRDLENMEAQQKTISYKTKNTELYGPIWIFVTLLVEFVILGHLSNRLETSQKQMTMAGNTGANEILGLLNQRVADASLKRIMKIFFILSCFYFGNPFVTYAMFKSNNAFEVTYLE